MEQKTKERRGYEIEVFMARMSVMIFLVIVINALIIGANTTEEAFVGIGGFGFCFIGSCILSLVFFPIAFIEYLLLDCTIRLLTQLYKFARRHR
jgi:hypothetical protein